LLLSKKNSVCKQKSNSESGSGIQIADLDPDPTGSGSGSDTLLLLRLRFVGGREERDGGGDQQAEGAVSQTGGRCQARQGCQVGIFT